MEESSRQISPYTTLKVSLKFFEFFNHPSKWLDPIQSIIYIQYWGKYQYREHNLSGRKKVHSFNASLIVPIGLLEGVDWESCSVGISKAEVASVGEGYGYALDMADTFWRSPKTRGGKSFPDVFEIC